MQTYGDTAKLLDSALAEKIDEECKWLRATKVEEK